MQELLPGLFIRVFSCKVAYIPPFPDPACRITLQGEAKKVLQVLQKPNVATELQYKFAPDLIMLDAYETVESWMSTKSLNPRKLIPAMMRYSRNVDVNLRPQPPDGLPNTASKGMKLMK
ncbi:hypothetical protein RDI58_014700 [Solanum bulbocastanum]|uniref:Uncharacterized protein n=1 Tax=Solanum bulbocastanum TaxID=147425 RepID=A0AAN8YAT7_SOLBU